MLGFRLGSCNTTHYLLYWLHFYVTMNAIYTCQWLILITLQLHSLNHLTLWVAFYLATFVVSFYPLEATLVGLTIWSHFIRFLAELPWEHITHSYTWPTQKAKTDKDNFLSKSLDTPLKLLSPHLIPHKFWWAPKEEFSMTNSIL